MVGHVTFSNITDQRTLTETANAATDDTPETPTALIDRAQQPTTNVAAEHFLELPVETIDWEISHRPQRQAGVTKYDPTTEAITSALTWTASEHHGWKIQRNSPARNSFTPGSTTSSATRITKQRSPVGRMISIPRSTASDSYARVVSRRREYRRSDCSVSTLEDGTKFRTLQL